MKTKIILIALLCLVGCGDRFRYGCQDPSNWENAECKKPLCEINRTCPDLLIKNDKRMSTPVANITPVEKKIDKKGDCK